VVAAQARGGLTPSEIAASLRAGSPVTDEAFDALYPAAERRRSGAHWTPVTVALRVSAMLSPCATVLDVGSGGGKMCAIGALTTRSLWTGVESDPRLVKAAIRTARDLGVDDRAQFIEGDAVAAEWTAFSGIYIYNPFAEAVFAAEGKSADEGQTAYGAAIEAVEAKLAALAPGTRVVTLFGFGGDVPDCFELMERVAIHGDTLCLWIRR
jgi:SAM-dependent methyltransferase